MIPGTRSWRFPFDAHAEGHRGGWAADAGPVHADADGVGGGDLDEFDVSAVGLDGRPDAFDDERDLVPQGVLGRVGGGWHDRSLSGIGGRVTGLWSGAWSGDWH